MMSLVGCGSKISPFFSWRPVAFSVLDLQLTFEQDEFALHGFTYEEVCVLFLFFLSINTCTVFCRWMGSVDAEGWLWHWPTPLYLGNVSIRGVWSPSGVLEPVLHRSNWYNKVFGELNVICRFSTVWGVGFQKPVLFKAQLCVEMCVDA